MPYTIDLIARGVLVPIETRKYADASLAVSAFIRMRRPEGIDKLQLRSPAGRLMKEKPVHKNKLPPMDKPGNIARASGLIMEMPIDPGNLRLRKGARKTLHLKF